MIQINELNNEERETYKKCEQPINFDKKDAPVEGLNISEVRSLRPGHRPFNEGVSF